MSTAFKHGTASCSDKRQQQKLLYAVRDYLRRSKQHEMFLSDIAKQCRRLDDMSTRCLRRFLTMWISMCWIHTAPKREIVSPLSLEP